MSGKFTVAFLALICLIQGFQARTVQLDQGRGIGDIINAIKDFADQIKENIVNIVGDIPHLLENLEKKIMEIVSQIDIDKIITGIQDKIDDTLAGAGIDVSEARECTDAQKASVVVLVEDIKEDILKCKEDADNQVAKLDKENADLKAKADILIEETFASVDSCIKDHGIDIIGSTKCLVNQLKNLKVTAGTLIEQAKETAHVAKETAIQLPINLSKCVINVNVKIVAKEKAIVEDFKTCLAEQKQY